MGARVGYVWNERYVCQLMVDLWDLYRSKRCVCMYIYIYVGISIYIRVCEYTCMYIERVGVYVHGNVAGGVRVSGGSASGRIPR